MDKRAKKNMRARTKRLIAIGKIKKGITCEDCGRIPKPYSKKGKVLRSYLEIHHLDYDDPTHIV